MSKSPTKAELIALTDNLGFVELFQEFVEFLTMSKQKPATIYQDCSAVVTLVMKGGIITRTKHLWARMNLGKEDVDENCANILHVKAEDMKADGFSKQYDPAEHKPFALMIQGEAEWFQQWVGIMKKREEKEFKWRVMERSEILKIFVWRIKKICGK
jgi:hypothetical protein